MAWIASKVLTVLWPVLRSCWVQAVCWWVDVPVQWTHPHKEHRGISHFPFGTFPCLSLCYLPKTKECMGWTRSSLADVLEVWGMQPGTGVSSLWIQRQSTSCLTHPSAHSPVARWAELSCCKPFHLPCLKPSPTAFWLPHWGYKLPLPCDDPHWCLPELSSFCFVGPKLETKQPSQTALIGFGNTAGLVSLLPSPVWK